MHNCQLSVMEECPPKREGVSASRSFTVYIYGGDSYAASMHCSCLNFITSGIIGHFW